MTRFTDERLRVALVEPWLGGSHRAFADGLARSLGLPCDVVSLPPTSWRRRMRYAAIPLSRALDALAPAPDVVLATDYVDLPALLALSAVAARTPAVLYFHENQLTYPRRDGPCGDPELGAVNVVSCLAAARCAFSSHSQREAFLAAIVEGAGADDGFDPAAIAAAIEERCRVVPCGVDLAPFDVAREDRAPRAGRPLRIAWPHRFDHDKNPDDFFAALLALATEGLPFEVAALGRPGMELPEIMATAKSALGDRVVAWGHLEGAAYAEALAACDVVVSTAYQETLGLAVIEAIRAGCAPLLPRRLSYPELLGAEADGRLFDDRGDLKRRLRRMVREPDATRASAGELWRAMGRFSWDVVGPRFRELLVEVATGRVTE
jgi:glycosyltransferase involved in cell wall biosynthesis